ncbi:PrgI family protein [Faecalibaculum rodentium]|jgi:hypothetical protein|uniref:PrgI family protein n=2 Tax=Faecalibaculum rodentium TaxID=1702221 RepID=UPI001C3D4B0D|nr:PrgI family protein [Faecalibaculum rodentium]
MKPSFVPKDIAEYEERIAFGLTARQMLWGGIAIASGLSFYCLTTLVLRLPDDLCIYGTVMLAFGLFWMGWRKWQNVRPYTDKVKAMWAFWHTKQRVVYTNEEASYLKGGKNGLEKTKSDRKINKQYITEHRKESRKRRK